MAAAGQGDARAGLGEAAVIAVAVDPEEGDPSVRARLIVVLINDCGDAVAVSVEDGVFRQDAAKADGLAERFKRACRGIDGYELQARGAASTEYRHGAAGQIGAFHVNGDEQVASAV